MNGFTHYLDQAGEGRSGFFAWVLGLVFIIALYFLGVALLTVAELVAVSMLVEGDASDELLNPLTVAGHFYVLSSFLPMIGALWLVQKKWHRRPWRLLMTAAPTFRWKLLWATGGLHLLLLTVLLFIEWLMAEPAEFRWVYDPQTYWPFLLVTLLMVPFQAASEEMLFRGYLGQMLTRFLKNKWLVYLVTSGLFASLHFYNPEASSSLGFYLTLIFAFGLMACVLTHFTNGLEAAMGLHIFNNAFVFAVASNDLADTAQTYLISLGEFSIDVFDTLLVIAFELLAVYLILKLCRPLYHTEYQVEPEMAREATPETVRETAQD